MMIISGNDYDDNDFEDFNIVYSIIKTVLILFIYRSIR